MLVPEHRAPIFGTLLDADGAPLAGGEVEVLDGLADELDEVVLAVVVVRHGCVAFSLVVASARGVV